MFKEIIKFIINNYQLFSGVILLVISIIVFILRKKEKNILIDNSASKSLIVLIDEAENKFGSGHGSEKMSYVLQRYCEINHLPLDNSILVILKKLVEDILSTPQKKK